MSEKTSWAGKDEIPDLIKPDGFDTLTMGQILFNPRTQEMFIVKYKTSEQAFVISRLYKKWYLRLWNRIRHFFGYREQIEFRTEDCLHVISPVGVN